MDHPRKVINRADPSTFTARPLSRVYAGLSNTIPRAFAMSSVAMVVENVSEKGEECF